MFEEPELGLVAHSPVSRQMAVDDSLVHWVRYISNTIVPTAAKHVEATEKWLNSKQVNNTAHNLAFNHDLSYFDFISQDARLGIEFARTMKGVSNTSYFDNSHLVKSYDWTSIGEGLIVDVNALS
jgi:6-hydroxytryprostatin B O-methyltransferase